MKVILDINPKDSSRVEMCTALLNSMTPSERKDFLNRIYGIHATYADTDNIKVYNHCDELLYKIREVDNATEKTFKKVYNEIDEMKSKIDAQAETIQKLCKVIKFILPRVNANPFSKEFEEAKKTLADTDSIKISMSKYLKHMQHNIKTNTDDIKTNINDIGVITEVVRLMLVSLLSNNDMEFKRRILEDAYNKLEEHATLFAFPPFD